MPLYYLIMPLQVLKMTYSACIHAHAHTHTYVNGLRLGNHTLNDLSANMLQVALNGNLNSLINQVRLQYGRR